MNTIGNLGGFAAGLTTGWVLERFSAARGYADGLNWQINFLSFAAVYGVAAVLWLNFDATRPVVPGPPDFGANSGLTVIQPTVSSPTSASEQL
jgi:hypothetical protein